MDLNAYRNIENLEAVAQANGIEVPRLRGYRLMGPEGAFTEKQIQDEVDSELNHDFRALIEGTARMMEAAMEMDIERYDSEKSWLHMHESRCWSFEKELREQLAMWNKYAGREDVLQIHSRMGGSELYHWDEETRECVTDYDLKDQPWFLDYVHDAYDSTYIDIYARIDPETVKTLLKQEEE